MARRQTKSAPLDEVKATLAHLDAEAERWRTAIDDARQARETVEVTAGRRLVDGEATDDDIARELAAANTKASAAERALREVDRRRIEARRAVLLAAAVDVENRAASIERELLDHRAKIDRLLDALEQLDEWAYVPQRLEDRVRAVTGVQDPRGVSIPASVTDRLTARVKPYREAAAQLRARAGGDLSSVEAWDQALSVLDNQLAKLEATGQDDRA